MEIVHLVPMIAVAPHVVGLCQIQQQLLLEALRITITITITHITTVAVGLVIVIAVVAVQAMNVVGC